MRKTMVMGSVTSIGGQLVTVSLRELAEVAGGMPSGKRPAEEPLGGDSKRVSRDEAYYGSGSRTDYTYAPRPNTSSSQFAVSTRSREWVADQAYPIPSSSRYAQTHQAYLNGGR